MTFRQNQALVTKTKGNSSTMGQGIERAFRVDKSNHDFTLILSHLNNVLTILYESENWTTYAQPLVQPKMLLS